MKPAFLIDGKIPVGESTRLSAPSAGFDKVQLAGEESHGGREASSPKAPWTPPQSGGTDITFVTLDYFVALSMPRDDGLVAAFFPDLGFTTASQNHFQTHL
ncbi:hypothetical protein [Oleiharenicola lentus]|uniref:hypothetical protein n=1 Tax=Oleiharenicola lentus TaxID=2508720 RepID=UPI003F67AA07